MALVSALRPLSPLLARPACRLNLPASSFFTSQPAPANVSVTTDEKGIAVLSMGRGPVNSLNKEFIEELNSSLTSVATEARGLVLTSSLPSVFCAGLEITEMHKPDLDRLRQFWSSLQNLWITLYSYPIPTAAAISGHSPAGGCLLAMCTDYRVMQGPKFTIGLNETQLGIVAPSWFKDTMLNTVGQRQTELALMLGTLFTAQQALDIGMVDKVVETREECSAAAYGVVAQLARIPSEARHTSKMLMRQATLDNLVNNKQADIDHFANFIVKPSIQKPLGQYLDALKAKAAAKKK